jgi:hypothetical protein
MVDAPDRPGTSATSGEDLAEASARWPDFAGLALARAEEELPRWGRSTLKFRDVSNPSTEPFFVLDNKDQVQHWEFVEGSVSTPCSLCAWSRILWCGVCRRPLR